MKNIILIAFVTVASSPSFARRCLPNAKGELIFSTRCDVTVASTSTSECHILRGGGPFPEDHRPVYHVHPWERVTTGSTAAICDGDLQDCKDLAFRELEKFSYTNNCGDVSVGKSVEYRFQNLNADGSVHDEISGRLRK